SRHAQVMEMPDGCRRGKPGVSASQLFRYIWMQACEAFDMSFIDHGLVPRSLGQTVVAPGESRLDNEGQWRKGTAVTFIEIGGRLRTAARPVERVVPAQVAADGFRIWVEQNLVRIEPMAFRRRISAVNSVTV